jgi:transcriptional regulator with XRE-family HTH domain
MFGGRLSWDERLKLIQQQFASAPLMGDESDETQKAWVKAFGRDPDLMGRILRDVLKADQAVPGRPGPRPALNAVKAEPVVDEWLGRDPLLRPYTLMPFQEAFTMLAGDRSLTAVARKCGLPRSQVHRLLRGEIQPTKEMMVKIAEGFGKAPSYFIEFRIGMIASAMIRRLSDSPERSVKVWEQLMWAASK